MNPEISPSSETDMSLDPPLDSEGRISLFPEVKKRIAPLLGTIALVAETQFYDEPLKDIEPSRFDQIEDFPPERFTVIKPYNNLENNTETELYNNSINKSVFDKLENPNEFKYIKKPRSYESINFEEKYSDILPKDDFFITKEKISSNPLPLIGRLALRDVPIIPMPDPERESQAQKYRRDKLRFGPLGEFISQIPSNPKIRSVVGTLLAVRDRLTKGTFVAGEKHRDLAALFAGLMTGPDNLRLETVDKLDESVQLESNALKAEAEQSRNELLDYDGLSADVLIVGTGIHGAVAAARIRAERPDARVIAIDQEDFIGGQFRKYGQRPTFFINSRNHRPESTRTGLPGSNGNLNPFGKKAPVQVTDVSSETYPTNVELGNAAAINLYLSAETMTGVRVVEMQTDEYGENQKVILFDEDEQRYYSVGCKQVVMATGLGERKLSSDRAENHWTAEDLLSHFGNPDNSFPMDEFIGKRIALIGGGDSGRVCAELFARLGPADAYGRSVSQLGGPDRIVWFGTDFADREEYCASNRPRYQRLASFIADRFGRDSDSLINPRKDKVTNIVNEDNSDKLSVEYGEAQRFSGFDYVIDARNLPDTQAEAGELVGSDFSGVIKDYLPDGRRSNKIQAGLRTLGRRVYLVGPPARSRLDADEQRRFSSGIKENTVSIWANTPRTEAIALEISRTLK